MPRERFEAWVRNVGWAGKRVIVPVMVDHAANTLRVPREYKWETLDGTFDLPLESQFALDDTAAQKLMDQLWDTGIRPTAGAGSAGQLSATLAHLEDMRSLVFKGKP